MATYKTSSQQTLLCRSQAAGEQDAMFSLSSWVPRPRFWLSKAGKSAAAHQRSTWGPESTASMVSDKVARLPSRPTHCKTIETSSSGTRDSRIWSQAFPTEPSSRHPPRPCYCYAQKRAARINTLARSTTLQRLNQFRASPVRETLNALSPLLALSSHSPIPSRAAMDAFFDIATPVPAEETEQVPRNYDTGSGTSSGSCTIA